MQAINKYTGFKLCFTDGFKIQVEYLDNAFSVDKIIQNFKIRNNPLIFTIELAAVFHWLKVLYETNSLYAKLLIHIDSLYSLLAI